MSMIKIRKQFPEKEHQIMQNFSDRQKRNSHEKSHQSSTIWDEIDEAITFWSQFNIELVILEVNLNFVEDEAEKDWD
jgi:hypothetical protein